MQLPHADRPTVSGDADARRVVLLLAPPETAEEAAEARRIGGLHRRKKKTVSAIYGFHGLRTIEDNLALLETAAIETLALENSIARNRALGGFAATGAKLIELGDHEERLRALEVAVGRPAEDDDPFDDLAS